MKTEGSRSCTRKIDKRFLIMQSAIDLFKERGYDGTRIIDIAERAGIGKGTVYEYFSCKEDLMSDVIKDVVYVDYMNFFAEASVLTAQDGIRKRLDAHIAGSERMIERYGLYARIFFTQIVDDSSVDSSKAMEMVKEMTDDQWKRIKTIISEEAELREKEGRNSLGAGAIEAAASVTLLLITSYLLSAIKRESAEGEEDNLYSDVPSIDRSLVVEYIVKGIGF